MKIALFVTEFPALSETFIINQITDLQARGHSVTVYSQNKRSSKKIHQSVLDSELLKRTFYLDVIPFTRFQKIRKLLSTAVLNINNKNIFLIFKNILKNKSSLSIYNLIPFLNHNTEYDVVHAHFGINGNYVVELQNLGLFQKAKFVTTFHGYDLNEIFCKTAFYKSLFARCHCFTVNSEYSKRLLLNLGASQECINVVPVGLSLNKFKPENENSAIAKGVKLLYVGRLVKFKGPDRFIEICQILKNRERINFTATIVGDGEMLQEVKKRVCDYNLENQVEITGAKTQEEIVKIMDSHDIFLYPGITHDKRAENQGLVIQEAQAMKLPVIISNAGGMHEGLQPNVTGFVLDENDVQGFVEKIKLLVANSSLRKKMGEEGRRFVTGKYDITKLNNRLIQLYETGKPVHHA